MSAAPMNLFLLPFSLGASSRRLIADSYKEPLSAALSQSKSPEHPATLIIAVVGDFLHQAATSDPSAKRISWPDAQSILAGLYSLVAYICAQQSIATDLNAGPNSVDARVVFVQDDRPGVSGHDENELNETIIQSLSGFASRGGSPDSIFYLKSEEGLRLVDSYAAHIKGGRPAVESRLIGLDCSVATQDGSSPQPVRSSSSQYQVVCLGGTFDHLHLGHKLLLSAAALLLRISGSPESRSRFIIGVTGDEMLKNKKFAEYVQPWDVRARGVLEFLHTVFDHPTHGEPTLSSPRPGELVGSFRGGAVVVECVVFQDLYGPTVTIEAMDALVVSGETRSGGKAVNDKRREQGWKELDVYEVDVLDARGLTDADPTQTTEGFGTKISSTAIRQEKAAECSGTGRL
ncbi:uncharacterized protein DNG_08827 [Cephalotrichum gorgonifer]|uniref:Cytidyltransferase-like domain-containing protein n=1 Tax=Cephalotrichum gorgonifer TaxID=2041049 RepID=A0AAE8N6B4_9PEZI|nr:uncharacterized protein DNG_08827 [Cephalotrichum gorgonifer]